MNTRQAEYESALDRLRADMAASREDMARRETRLLLAVAGLMSFGVVILGILIRFPA